MAFYTPGTLPDSQTLYMSLDRWQELMPEICLCAFNGIRKETSECCNCDSIWTQADRDALATVLAQAEEMRETELGYHLAPKYIVDDKYEVVKPLILDKKYLVSLGKQAFSDLALATPLALSIAGVIQDPVTVVVATVVTDSKEIKVYYPGTDIEIRPSSVTIAGGNVTIKIPRCRLADPDALTSCEPFPDYSQDTNFISTIDVKRSYTDPTNGALIVWDSGCCADCGEAIAEVTQTLYPRVEDSRLSIVSWKPGHYTSGSWYSDCCYNQNCRASSLRISYLSGRKSSVSMEMLTARLAHTLLPSLIPSRLDLCKGCWGQDMERDSSKLITPYGDTRGAIAAWMADSRAKIGWGGKTPRGR